MIRQFIALYRARTDAALAKCIANEMIVDGVIDYAGWPLTTAKLWMGAGVVITSILIIAFLLIGSFSHWILAMPAIPLGVLVYAIIRIWRGMNAGIERVSRLAKTELHKRTENLQIRNLGKTATSGDNKP